MGSALFMGKFANLWANTILWAKPVSQALRGKSPRQPEVELGTEPQHY